METLEDYIQIKVHLKIDQKKELNHWKLTVNGEERDVTIPTVVWYEKTLEKAINSFKMEEVHSFEITGLNIK
jgi:hypothetical protein